MLFIIPGAHNTIVTSRAGKDLVSCLVSGLLTIGPRFGGAIDDAARCFQRACDEVPFCLRVQKTWTAAQAHRAAESSGTCGACHEVADWCDVDAVCSLNATGHREAISQTQRLNRSSRARVLGDGAATGRTHDSTRAAWWDI